MTNGLKYEVIYNRYANVQNYSETDDGFRYQLDRKDFNAFAHRQAIVHMIAEALEVGIDFNYIGPKHKNPDLDKEYFKSLGFRDKYETDYIKLYFNRLS